MVVNSTTTYQSEKQKLLALPPGKRAGRTHTRTRPAFDAPPPYSPTAGNNETTLFTDDESDTASTVSTDSTCSSCIGSYSSTCSSTSSQAGTYSSTTTNGISSTTTSAFSTPGGFESTSSYTSYDQGFATFMTLTTRVVPITSLPPAYPRCSSCADGYPAAQLGLSCPNNCMPAHTF
ncbi:uncharacterized protein CcaverHIS019_0405890 [Cutaneotrichosporon cavernicola]|uniref:Uncharacterized protein n=1 Tax=Cutaneotrichosporon cavernicola TaxID=279322 RepID=A0AA48QVW1_9TREE|nr:uncharacterized protein CcaverHIS019_0405890 [Cutaneotrichosporon cavernicola]BEI91769.1 hypothetical protein CcaverHIS019_0405890 [Cutaneotrichosporon cavernicola]BEI99541.1 hypothetical protein CcaverHIS631_0405840 [Cutaneotrichosporon cavernicola]BEJ07318.1 hypothetical protein CcaverHIS641_0405870 [Cutaneotrichosporon cavernicola]